MATAGRRTRRRGESGGNVQCQCREARRLDAYQPAMHHRRWRPMDVSIRYTSIDAAFVTGAHWCSPCVPFEKYFEVPPANRADEVVRAVRVEDGEVKVVRQVQQQLHVEVAARGMGRLRAIGGQPTLAGVHNAVRIAVDLHLRDIRGVHREDFRVHDVECCL